MTFEKVGRLFSDPACTTATGQWSCHYVCPQCSAECLLSKDQSTFSDQEWRAVYEWISDDLRYV